MKSFSQTRTVCGTELQLRNKPVHKSTGVSEAPAQGQAWFAPAPRSNAASDTRKAVDRVADATRRDWSADEDGTEAAGGVG
jgi:hypothetical protein